MSSTKACARCYRLKVKCKPIDDSEGAGCLRCQSAKIICSPRPVVSASSSDGPRPGSKQETVERLASRVQELCENVAALQERGGQHSKLWRDLNDIELIDLFEQYRDTMAAGYPMVPKTELVDPVAVRVMRPLLFRTACCAAVGTRDSDLCLNLLKENYKYLCDVNLSDVPPSLDMIEALYINAIYFPFQDASIFRTIMGASNMAYQNLQELQVVGPFKQPSLEFHRCKLAVYFLCNSSRLWQKFDFRLIKWSQSHEEAAAVLEASDDNDRVLAESVRYMKIAEGIIFLSSPEFSTEDIFRQYLAVFEAKRTPPIVGPIDFSKVMLPLFKSMNCIPLIDAYLDLYKEGDATVNIPLCFQAIANEGQGVLDHLQRLCDSHLRFPTFFYLRALRSVLAIAYFCRTWGNTYYEQLIVELRPLYNELVQKWPFLSRTRNFLDGVDTWYQTYNPLQPETSLFEVLEKFAPGRRT